MRKVYLCAVGFHLRKCSKPAAIIGSDGAKNLRKPISKFVIQLPHCIRNALCRFLLNANGKIIPRQALHNRERYRFTFLFSPKYSVGLPMFKLNSFCHFRRPKVNTFSAQALRNTGFTMLPPAEYLWKLKRRDRQVTTPKQIIQRFCAGNDMSFKPLQKPCTAYAGIERPVVYAKLLYRPAKEEAVCKMPFRATAMRSIRSIHCRPTLGRVTGSTPMTEYSGVPRLSSYPTVDGLQ
ncbi:hypothetical protein [Caproicibacterium amylolyticum]|uniref:hypothetical protein n=1 Tax=Caproicibacterium amylolyticum TaxID=2766537 RepID=UPI001FE3D63E|nr:hypothetical protein [Caproicibacterium amylolyticum]